MHLKSNFIKKVSVKITIDSDPAPTMKNQLKALLDLQHIHPLSYYFAQFIAQKNDASMDSLLCLTAALISHRNLQGDICIDLRDFANLVAFHCEDGFSQELAVFPSVEQWIKELSRFECVSAEGDKQPLIIDEHFLYLGKLWHFEQFIVQNIEHSLNQASTIDRSILKKGLATLFPKQNNLIDWQKIAASIAVTQKFSVISGGPGTGKTTTLIKIIALLLDQNSKLNVQLCAPTGKAAIRMLEAITSRKNELNLTPEIIAKMPQQAKTIHRLLAYRQGTFSHNEHNPLICDCLIIDEASMIDLELMYHLLRALPKHCKVILVGDKDQLSSVDAGHVFSDICGRGVNLSYSLDHAEKIASLCDIDTAALKSSKSAPLIANSIGLLKTSYRFNNSSGIGMLATHVNKGQGAESVALLQQPSSELTLIEIKQDEQLPKQAIEIALAHYEKVVSAQSVEQAIELFSQFQLLCAVRNGPFGVDVLNELVTLRLLLRKKISNPVQFNGMPLLITQNDYENNLYNGDIGMLWQSNGLSRVYFPQSDGTIKNYPIISLSHYQTAWAITVHKSQGSEYNAVLLVLPNTDSSQLIKRELIYTGITRAKAQFTICCNTQQFEKNCAQKTSRSTGLRKHLNW